MDYKFQINLGGIIDLLSNHIYSSPQIYVRELLQNGVDAILARRHVQPEHAGAIRIEVFEEGERGQPSLVFEDNGIGLDEEEIHRFLATIGQTSKRGSLPSERTDYIGQFGIGLLSCFVVSDEIVVVTRSAKSESSPTIEWRGRADGTYSIKMLDDQVEPGTRVRLLCKAGSEQYFKPQAVRRMARHYGSLLPYPITLTTGGAAATRVNAEPPPWKQTFIDANDERKAYLDYGRETFEMEFFDYVPLRARVGDVEGAAYVLPFSPSLATKKTHKVYLKNMLVSENAEGLLPDWAFFVKCVVNANDLRPTASRESFYEDERLNLTRAALGRSLREYLVELAREQPQRLQKLISLHYLSIKALAVDDDEFYQLFIDWLPFETSAGQMTLGEYKRQHQTLSYVPDLDQFRQISRVAASQSLVVINAGYVHDAELLSKHADVFPAVPVAVVDSTRLMHSFEFLTLDEQEAAADFVRFADGVLRPFNCAAEVRKFRPRELPALYNASSEVNFVRAVEQAREVSDTLWSGVLGNLAGGLHADAFASLCFNYDNPLVYKLSRMRDETLLRLSVQMLYVQSLLLSHRPLNVKEMSLLNDGLLGLLEWGVEVEGGWVQ
ncbi:MAG: molecular chaperone HtpG [Pyrinomonadaceae bacterium]|nr:molecular chaperone HtpG [Pyrinomonadaceae bacterium]